MTWSNGWLGYRLSINIILIISRSLVACLYIKPWVSHECQTSLSLLSCNTKGSSVPHLLSRPCLRLVSMKTWIPQNRWVLVMYSPQFTVLHKAPNDEWVMYCEPHSAEILHVISLFTWVSTSGSNRVLETPICISLTRTEWMKQKEWFHNAKKGYILGSWGTDQQQGSSYSGVWVTSKDLLIVTHKIQD